MVLHLCHGHEADNEADEIQGQTRQHSRLTNLLGPGYQHEGMTSDGSRRRGCRLTLGPAKMPMTTDNQLLDLSLTNQLGGGWLVCRSTQS